MQKASNAFCPAHVPHEHHCTLLTAFLSTKTSAVHWSGKHTPGFFFPLGKVASFPAVVKSDFSSDCPSAADIYLIWGRKITYFLLPAPLWGQPGEFCCCSATQKRIYKGWQERLYASYPNKGSKGWKWYCKQDYTQRWGENNSLEVGTGCNLIYLQILGGEERTWWCFVFQPI